MRKSYQLCKTLPELPATQELLAIPGLLERVKKNQTTPKTDFTNWRNVRQQFQSE